MAGQSLAHAIGAYGYAAAQALAEPDGIAGQPPFPDQAGGAGHGRRDGHGAQASFSGTQAASTPKQRFAPDNSPLDCSANLPTSKKSTE
jgi:hypothetical protein